MAHAPHLEARAGRAGGGGGGTTTTRERADPGGGASDDLMKAGSMTGDKLASMVTWVCAVGGSHHYCQQSSSLTQARRKQARVPKRVDASQQGAKTLSPGHTTPALRLSPAASHAYEQETRRLFVQWKAKYKITYKYAGEEECRYALFKDTRRSVARDNATGVTTSGLNGLSAHAIEEIRRGHRVQMGERWYEEETRRMFVGWKAKYDKSYRDVGEEECRYMLFKGNRRVIVELNAAAAGKTAYGLNQFGDLTNEEVRECCDGRGGEIEGKLSAMCQAAVAGYIGVHDRPIRSQVCRCITSELKQTESGGTAIPGDEARMQM
ncbi:hypothetical protein C2845_PM03G36110 [Panicum miliaceum]|uniref:Cathepsin propeptide inhibitor domain-containing protein n=1 Tax=Panicum miliaceum TaxID=4540 RepID=A0A3L6TF65_PANMI|nr:hypothetical protein C2845_PM03G36110 [Panicum miliaceum]